MAIRMAAYLAPIVAAWLMVRLASQWFVDGDGWSGVVLWLVQAVPVAVATSAVAERFTRRLLPLATLLSLSLAFPDQAPSKFSVALRAGSTRRLQARVSELRTEGLGSDAGRAAAAALELVAALSMHDRRTRGHTERVRAYADLIAEELDLPEADRLRLAWGVLLHDVGKLTVPSEILNKTEPPLTRAEWEILQSHPEASGRILEPMAEWLGPWALAGAEHHERWDGHGYPFGLAGEEISLAGRITAVADAYDEPLDTVQAATSSVTTVATTSTSTSTTTSTSTSTTTPTSTTSITSTTTTITTTSLALSAPVSWSLGSGGHTTSQLMLPLDGSPVSDPLPNYDTDRDESPGLLVERSDDGLVETNKKKTQTWGLQPGNVRFRGVPTLSLWAAFEDFETSKNGTVVAGLYDCDVTYGDCSLVGDASADVSGGTNFGVTTLFFPAIDRTFTADRSLVLKVAVGADSDEDLWLAYGTDHYDSVLSIN